MQLLTVLNNPLQAAQHAQAQQVTACGVLFEFLFPVLLQLFVLQSLLLLCRGWGCIQRDN